MTANPWADVEIDPSVPPLLLLGSRLPRSRLGSVRIELGENLVSPLAALVEEQLERLRSSERAVYSPDDTLEPGEYFAVGVDDLPTPEHTSPHNAAEVAVADLLRLVRDADQADPLPADETPQKFLFYAICPHLTDGSRVGFVRKRDPRAVLRTPRLFLRRNAGALTRIDESPEFILDLQVDLVVGPEIAIFDPQAFTSLFSDASLLLASASALAAELGPGLGMTMTASGLAELTASAASKLRIASRLNRIATRLDTLRTSGADLKSGFATQGLDPSDFLTIAGELDCPAGRAPDLLDAIEGRFFAEAFTPEKRRATSFRRIG